MDETRCCKCIVGLLVVCLVLLIALAMSGCATWTHPTKTERDYYADLYDCEVQAAPVQNEYRVLQMKIRCMQIKGWRSDI